MTTIDSAKKIVTNPAKKMVNMITPNKPKNKMLAMFPKNISDKNKKFILFGILTLVLLFIFFAVMKYRQIQRNKRLNPVFLKNSKDAKRQYVIPGNKLPHPSNGYDMSITFWIYLNDWKYRKGKWKHILHKGRANTTTNSTPGFWLRPTNNDLRIQIATRFRRRLYQSFYLLRDIPLKKWTQIGVIVQTNTIDIYQNGKLKKSETLRGLPVLNHGNMYINKWGGFSGIISSVSYTARSMNPVEIAGLYNLGPYRENKFTKAVKAITYPVRKIMGTDKKKTEAKCKASG